MGDSAPSGPSEALGPPPSHSPRSDLPLLLIEFGGGSQEPEIRVRRQRPGRRKAASGLTLLRLMPGVS